MQKLAVLVGMVSLVACDRNADSSETNTVVQDAKASDPTEKSPAAPAEAKPPSKKEAKVAGLETLQAFVNAASANGIELASHEIFNEESDPNNLLGRPGQYVAKMSWKVDGGDATLEVFANLEDAKKRQEYVEKIAKSAPMFLQYIYLNEDSFAVLRIPKEASPSKAEEWNKMFQGLGLNDK